MRLKEIDRFRLVRHAWLEQQTNPSLVSTEDEKLPKAVEHLEDTVRLSPVNREG